MKSPCELAKDQECLRLFVKVWVRLGIVNYETTWYSDYYWGDPDGY